MKRIIRFKPLPVFPPKKNKMARTLSRSRLSWTAKRVSHNVFESNIKSPFTLHCITERSHLKASFARRTQTASSETTKSGGEQRTAGLCTTPMVWLVNFQLNLFPNSLHCNKLEMDYITRAYLSKNVLEFVALVCLRGIPFLRTPGWCATAGKQSAWLGVLRENKIPPGQAKL